MAKTLSRRKSTAGRPAGGSRKPDSPPALPVGTGRRRVLGALSAAAAVLVLLGAGAAAWRWSRRRTAAGPAAPTGAALPPTEVRLLAAAAREPGSPRPWLELAEEYAASSRPASALWAYGEAASRAPQDDAVRLKLAAALTRLGAVDSAASMLRTITASQARLDLADLFLSTGRPAAALAILREAGPEAEVARGRAHEAAGDRDAAEAAYRRAGAAGDPEGYQHLARLELATGQEGRREAVVLAQEAVRSLGGLRAARPDDLVLTAAIHAAAGTPQELDKALQQLLRCLELQPRNAEARYQAGLLFLRKGDRAAAVDQLERAVQLDPNHAEALARLADLLESMGQTARACRQRAAYFVLKDQPDRSLAELRRAGAAGDANDRQRTLLLVRTASELQQLATAVAEAEAGLKRYPGDPDLMLELGLLYLQGARASLERLCRDWMAKHPSSGVPYWLLGRRAVGDSRIEDAIPLFEAACAREPNRSDFCEALGTAYLAVPTPENLARARPWLEKAVALSPRSALAHQQLGRALELLGEPQAARQQYLQSLDVDPGQTAVLNNLAQMSARLGSPEAAHLYTDLARSEEERTRERRRLSRRVREHPADAAARIDLARFLIRNGRLAAARNQLERAAEAAPLTAPAHRLLANVTRLLRVQSG